MSDKWNASFVPSIVRPDLLNGNGDNWANTTICPVLTNDAIQSAGIGRLEKAVAIRAEIAASQN